MDVVGSRLLSLATSVRVLTDGTLEIDKPQSTPIDTPIDTPAAAPVNMLMRLHNEFVTGRAMTPPTVSTATGQPLTIPGQGLPFCGRVRPDETPMFSSSGWMIASYWQHVFHSDSHSVDYQRAILAHFAAGQPPRCDRLHTQSRLSRSDRALWSPIYSDARFSPNGRWLLTFQVDGVSRMIGLSTLLPAD